ncbi:MAG: class I SAM-dependent methyltransferase [Trichodesmium sp. MO_231.B1]|nr:class I SAM-dependent methyltransferase [Trichodesmium sp. MO_231.B1]
MITVKEAREKALSFLSKQGLEREFIENVSVKLDDAEKLINISRKKQPQKILEIGTFVGVSTAVLGLCLPETKIVCIDADLPVTLQNILCVKKFEINNEKTNLYFVEKVLQQLEILTRFTLKRGFFSCCFPNKEDLDQVVNYGIKPEDREIIGPKVCEKYGPFDMAFLDADHRKEAVKQDLILLSRYIRPGGAIVLHDVGLDYWGQEVRQGVEQFLKEYPQKEFRIEGEIGFISI